MTDDLLEDYEAMKAHNVQLMGEVAGLRAENRSLQDQLNRWNVWKQFHGRLMSVQPGASDEERVLRQASIISHMQRRIRFQRAEIRRLMPADRMVPRPHMAYNVYRHCNKLYNMWWETKKELVKLTPTPPPEGKE